MISYPTFSHLVLVLRSLQLPLKQEEQLPVVDLSLKALSVLGSQAWELEAVNMVVRLELELLLW